jgi:aspartyl/asparaginyl beta-hydroxylase (cupin superfamily)
MAQDVSELVQAAGRAANAGRWKEAENLWNDVLRREPSHPLALSSLGIHALQRGELDKGLQHLKAARECAPDDLFVLMTLIDVYRAEGRPNEERDAIDAALAVDPYFVPALLARGNWLEHYGTEARAASVYANAIKVSPPEKDWPAAYCAELGHAKRIVDRHSEKLSAHLTERLAELKAKLSTKDIQRWNEAVSIRAGRSVPYTSESNQLHVPRLPAIPFFDRKEFPFLDALEARTDVIREELLEVLRTDRDEFKPYIAYEPGQPVNHWQELDHSDKWSALQLWKGGEPIQDNLDRCPATAAALCEISKADISGLCPNALFSALAPNTRIPPHNGETNARLVAHLPLIIPDGCGIRVGFEQRQWRVGKAIIFDDTIQHEAWNSSDELRVVLIFDVWNPLLSETERKLVNAMAEATREYA